MLDLESHVLNNVSLENLPHAAKQIIQFAGPIKIWTFEGEMGAGKTTLIKRIVQAMKSSDTVSSPTFGIVNEYQIAEGKKINHFDFYRISSEKEAFDIGCNEYFYSGDYCFVEWPSKISSLLPDQRLKISIGVQSINHRTITLTKLGN